MQLYESRCLFFNVGKIGLRNQTNLYDRGLAILAIVITAISVIFVANSSAPQAQNVFGDRFYFAKQQALWGFLGVIGMFLGTKIHYSTWKKLALPLFLVTVVLLVMVLIPGLGLKIYGARRWLSLGPLSFQPSELAKLTLAIYLASILSGKKNLLAFILPFVLFCGLVIAQPDLGTMLIIGAIGVVQLFISGVNIFIFSGISLIGIILSAVLVIISGYRRERFMHFLESMTSPLSTSYHVRQVLLALGSGGLFGVGLGQSRQKYLFLPESAADSIFAVIAEEIGFLGALVLIILFMILIFKSLRITKEAPDNFATLLAAGITAWIGSQTVLNIGSMVALVPLTGVPLPLFSYGGSAMVNILFAIGILLNISKYGIRKR